MRKTIITTCAAAIVCGSAIAKSDNPFLGKNPSPYGIPQFDKIKVEHYKPAFIKGMEPILAASFCLDYLCRRFVEK